MCIDGEMIMTTNEITTYLYESVQQKSKSNQWVVGQIGLQFKMYKDESGYWELLEKFKVLNEEIYTG